MRGAYFATPSGSLQKVQVVTRLKDSADYGVVGQREAPEAGNIICDEVIVWCTQQDLGPQARLRRIEVRPKEKHQTMVSLTNQLKLVAATVAAIYRGALGHRRCFSKPSSRASRSRLSSAPARMRLNRKAGRL